MTISYSLRREKALACHRLGKAFNGDGYTRAITNAQGTVTGRSCSLFPSSDFKSPKVHKERPL